jgi:ribosomal protein S18 acetylase RimI-like enzyme
MTTSAVSFTIRDADESDGPRLLDLLGDSAAADGIRWSITPGGDFFASLKAEADGWTVAVAEDERGRVLGFLSVAVRTAAVLGRPRTTCYITNFKVRPEFRRQGIGDALCRRAREFCRAVGGESIPVLMAVRTGNQLMSGRVRGPRGLPGMTPFARVAIHSFHCHRAASIRGSGFDVREASAADLEEMAALEQEVADERQFAPARDAAGLLRWIEGAPGLALADHLIARSQGRIAGWMGFWDERILREVRVAGYSRAAAAARVLHDARALLLGKPRPPRTGERVGCARAVHSCIPTDRPDVLRALLAEGARRRDRDCRWLKIALDERESNAAALSGLRSRAALYQAHVTSPSGSYTGPALDDRPLHFEVALA